MDLHHTDAGQRRVWFPRPRGDGPPRRRQGRRQGRVSPPTRGWTQLRRLTLMVRGGFPAHAGMDPPRQSRRGHTPRFPRPRGDGPLIYRRLGNSILVSPPTRGWTPNDGAQSGRGKGFPAHAGMDPSGCIITLSRAWFPRPRGDGPRWTLRMEPDGSVSPPTRGWTCTCTGDDDQSYGFPAHAGMDLHRHGAAGCISWFPRPRGDGPLKATVPDVGSAVSPPTRGWTPPSRIRAHPAPGFPAHAGMDLTTSRRWSRW